MLRIKSPLDKLEILKIWLVNCGLLKAGKG
jgi:hypothetical protein